MPYATVRWIDQKNRFYIWSDEVASWDQDQIKASIRSQSGAKELLVHIVKG